MKKITFVSALFIFFLLSFQACKKDEIKKGATINLKSDISLSGINVVSAGVELNWTLKNDSISRVFVMRKIGEDDGTLNGYTTIGQYILPGYTSYTDDNVPFERVVTYKIGGVIYDSYTGYESHNVYSNAVKYERDINSISYEADNVLFQEHNLTLFFFNSDAGEIMTYNLNTEEQNIIEVNSQIGHCLLSNYNSNYELLVPRFDGWLFVYNADSLTLKYQVKISGDPLSSVAESGGQLFINTYNNYESVYVVDRETQTILKTHDWGYTGGYSKKIQVIPGTTTEVFDVSNYSLTYASFDEEGNLILKKTNSDWGSNNEFSDNYKVFPGSKKVICAPLGTIYNTTTNYVNGLPYGSLRYSDFLFNGNGSEVYAGCSNNKTIEVYNTVSLQSIKLLDTQAYPFRLFYSNGQIICVSVTSSSSYNGYYSKFLVEYINQTID